MPKVRVEVLGDRGRGQRKLRSIRQQNTVNHVLSKTSGMGNLTYSATSNCCRLLTSPLPFEQVF